MHHGVDRSSAPRTARMYQRRRAVTACLACRTRKTKCDNVRPVCGFCSRNQAECIYSESSKDYSTFDPASLTILDRVNYAISLLEGQGRQLAPEGVPVASPASLISLRSSSHHAITDASPSSAVAIGDATRDVPSDDYLSGVPEYPSNVINCEATMRWPVFEGSVPNVQSFILEADDDDARPGIFGSGAGAGIREEDFIPLSKKFLAYVHVKNPILDPAQYRSYVWEAVTNGIGWDGPSCLVLITCAVASLSSRYQAGSSIQIPTSETDRSRAAAYYLAAKKRLGLIEPSLLSVQCLFLCGVLEMYLLNPLKAWYYFSHASTQFRDHLWRTTQKRSGQVVSRETKRLEQRLYWSCMKSECELRCEIPLPTSGITQFGYPDLFPSPPTEMASPTAEHLSSPGGASRQDDVQPEEERSWLYYLAEISYRRILNRAITTFGSDGYAGWIANIGANLKHREAFEDEMNIWCSHIPPQLSIYQNEMAPNEMATYIHTRANSFREWIHRPFLYYVIHQPADDPYLPVALPLAQRCLDLCVEGQKLPYAYHRHHGTWLIGRAMTTRAMMILAAARSGRLQLPGDWMEAVEVAVKTLRWWEGEAPDFRLVAEVLESVAAGTYGRRDPGTC
ncbi:hypothetical protein CONLIGDRAFT_659864 [Coniochaeta ligniaria NRRL 30616]|uniref:Zn(2)-C6 fungal-type domain-containing protein n=1 Tax=Coniochaeta ligniaria NRRL 30616 TaxID=1408157 RepID=A0A1J7IW01_9PEZI|nr:hypothetical protein CONLIGDRAFT_659864 [Coniochaeta ligniaria NRRL 30616]